jgi:DNA polymerase-3 subunit epsilon
MFAIVDIETTGGSSSREKITEICVVLHDGLRVTDHYTTLVNPERQIPYQITRLTGITNEMVSGAPRFYEVAKKIVELTEGRVFVAHNVNFDYNFIRNEFSTLGFDFKRKKVCTVRLSRKLIPGHRSYSLGKICNDLGIVIQARHRAEGDAFATAKLFELLLSKDAGGVINKSKETDELYTKLKTGPVNPLVEKLPEKTGVYYFYDSEGNIIYIGKSLNIRSRVITHFANASSKKALSMANAIHDICYELTGSELVALLLESHEIKKYKPLYNRMNVRSVFSFGVNAQYDTSGYLRLLVEKNKGGGDSFISFVNMDEAKNFLYAVVEEHELCQKLCGLYESEQACFHYQVKKCNGACIGKEDAEVYNERVMALVRAHRFSNESFFVLDKGRSPEERSVVKVENGKYCGFGYVNEEEGINSIEALHPVINAYTDNRDVRHILRNYLAAGKMEKVLKFSPYYD